MGVRLMIEVLDHYHGPDHRKLWLLAWAENAKDKTRQGWPGRPLLAQRTGKSLPRVSGIAAELAREGVIKRVGGGGRYRGEARYELLPLAAGDHSQGSPVTHPDQGSPRAHPDAGLRVLDPGSQGSPAGSQGSRKSRLPAGTPYNRQEPSGTVIRARATAAQAILAAFPDATDDEIRTILDDREPRARNLPALIAHEIREGTLRLPCNRDGPGDHTDACRHGEPAGCAYDWCACRCHTPPKEAGP